MLYYEIARLNEDEIEKLMKKIHEDTKRDQEVQIYIRHVVSSSEEKQSMGRAVIKRWF